MKDTILTKTITAKVQDLDSVKGVVKIAIAGFNNIDSDNEIIASGAFNKTIKENLKRIRHLKDHNFTQLLGLPLEFHQTKDNLIAVSAINKDKQIARDVLTDYLFFAEHSRTIEHSIGFLSFADKTDFDETLNARVFKEVKLLEYSTLSFLGANENTPFLGMKAQDFETMLNYSYSDERLQQIENNINKLNSFFDNKEEPSNTQNNSTEPLIIDTSKEFFKQLKEKL